MATQLKNFRWSQSADEKVKSFEIRLPMFPDVRPKELQVLVKDEDVLCIKKGDGEVLIQSRLQANIEKEIEWRVEDGELFLDCVKKEEDVWHGMLKLPMAATDSAMLTRDELDDLLQTEVQILPVDPEASAKTADPEDPDSILDDAVAEVKEADLTPMLAAELKGMREEDKELQTLLKELTEKLETAEEAEKPMLTLKLEGVQRMATCNRKIREIRMNTPSIKSFQELIQTDINKARHNIGQMDERETEPYANDEEAKLTPHELLTKGAQAVQSGEIHDALHYLRLAAIHHRHPSSTCLLHRLYMELGKTPQAAYFILKRANDEDIDVPTNILSAEMFDAGRRHFPPLLALSVYYYQRAASAGSVHAMISLAQLFMRGGCAACMTSEAVRESNKSSGKVRQWLKHAEARGSPASYYVLCNCYLRGEHGFEKSYAKAKEYLDRSIAAHPDFAKQAPMLEAALEQLRTEQGVPRVGEKQSPTTGAVEPVGAGRNVRFEGSAADKRLSQLEETSGSATSFMEKPQSKNSASSKANKRFWEQTVRWGVTTYAIYSLAFPIRIMLAPQFFSILGGIISMFTFGGGPQRQAGLMM